MDSRCGAPRNVTWAQYNLPPRLISHYSVVLRLLLFCLLTASICTDAAAISMFPGDKSGEKPQSKLFYCDGSWWCVLDGPEGVAIYEKVGTSWEVGPFNDAVLTPNGYADVKWNGTHLFVLVYTSSPKLYKLRYDGSLRIFQLESGFPVSLANPSGSETMVLEQDSTGRLWATAEGNNDINVYYSTSADHRTWTTSPLVLRSGVSSDDISSIIAFDGKVGVFWSDQVRDEFGFRVHKDSDSPTQWGQLEIVDAGSGYADDHVNLACDSHGRVFAVTKDDHDEMTVHRRSTNGSWSRKRNILGNTGTRGIIMINEADNHAYVLYTRWGVSPHRIEYMSTGLDALAFAGPTTFITAGSNLNNVTGTKQILPAGSLIAIASTGSYHYESVGTLALPVSPPENVIATLLRFPTRVEISWMPPTSGSPTGYNVYRQLNSGSFVRLNTTEISGTSFTDTSPPEGYLCYQVRSVSSSESAPSNSDCVDNSDVPPPGAPLDLTTQQLAASTSGAVVFWFDENGGQQTVDASGNGHDARLGSSSLAEAADPTWIPGVSGSALEFDGFDDYLYVAHAPELAPPGSFTVEAWVRRDAATTGTLVNKGGSGDDTHRVLLSSSGTVQFRWEDGAGSTWDLETGSDLDIGNWHHVACVYDQAQNENRIYVDGVLAARGFATGSPAANTDQMHLGARLSSSLKDFFAGAIDEFQITHAALYYANFVPQPGLSGRASVTVRLAWTAPVSGGPAVGYHIERSANGSGMQRLTSSLVGATTWTDPSPPLGQVCYQVVAQNVQEQEGPASNTACEEIQLAAEPPPGAPEAVSVVLLDTTPASALLQWQAPTSGATPTGYNVYRSVEGAASMRLNSTPIIGLEYTDTDVALGENCYQVNAVDFESRDGALSSPVCLHFTAAASPPPEPPTGLHAIWVDGSGGAATGAAVYLLDEGSGDTASDATGAGHTAQLGSTPELDTSDPTWISGVAGQALAFDGTDYLLVESTAALQFAGSFTLEAWVKREFAGTTDCIVAKGGSNARNYWMMLDDGGQVNFRWETQGGSNHGTVSSATVGVGQWQHVACVYDQTAGENRIYIDGKLVHRAADSGTPQVNDNPVYIGTRVSGSRLTSYFNGSIDLVRLAPGVLYGADFTPPTEYGTTQPVVQVDWSATGDVAGYKVYRSVGADAPVLLHAGLINATQFTDRSPIADNACYQVSGVDAAGQEGTLSEPSCLDDGTAPAPSPPGSPQELTAERLGSTPESVRLSWQAPTDSSASLAYHVDRHVDAGDWSRLTVTPVAALEFIDVDPPSGALCYRVSAVDSLGQEGTASDPACTEITPSAALDAPLNLAALVTAGNDAVEAAASYGFDEGQGDSAADGSGAGHTARLGDSEGLDTDDPEWIAGALGNALHFDGTDYLEIASTPALQFDTSFTLEAWVWRDFVGTTDCIVSKGGSNTRNYWMMLDDDGAVDFRWETEGGANHGTVSRATVGIGAWHHVACVWDQGQGEDRIYIDGTLIHSTADSGTPVTNDDVVFIGTRASGSRLKSYFNGAIDLVRLSPSVVYTGNFTPPLQFGDAPSGVQLTWSAPSSGLAAGYRVYRSETDSTFVEITTEAVTETSYFDATGIPSACYRVTAVDVGGSEGPASETVCVGVPTKSEPALIQAPVPLVYGVSVHPNPFNPATRIVFELPHASPVQLLLFDVAGRRVARLVAGHRDAGHYSVAWDGRTETGQPAGSGTYFVLLRAGSRTATAKLVVVK